MRRWACIAPHGMVGPGGGRCAGDGCGITFSDERGDSSPAAASSPTRRSRRWIRLRHSSRPSDSYQPHGLAANFTLLPEAAARVLIRPGAIWAGQTSVVEVKREKRGLSARRAVRSARHRSISAPVRAISDPFIGAVAVRLYNHLLCAPRESEAARSEAVERAKR